MANSRRDVIKMMALSGLGATGLEFGKGFSGTPSPALPDMRNDAAAGLPLNMIGLYGIPLTEKKNETLPSLSFRKKEYTDIETWRPVAREALKHRIGMPVIEKTPSVNVEKKYTFDGLQVEELSWQMPYGPITHAILLKPADSGKRLPGVLAFHDHGGNKFFGKQKITKTGADQHPMMTEHQKHYYTGAAWANELARRGYIVLIPDVFTFESRRVMLKDVDPVIRNGITDPDPRNQKEIDAYNGWASDHEHIMAKSLFSAGTTWPGLFLADDTIALNILCDRPDVDPERIGCGGLSGGGIRTVYMSGVDPRIKCCAGVGFMTTWDDFALYKSYTHTWMTYAPLLPGELEFPEIMGIRAPMPAMVLNNSEDQLFTLPEMKKAEVILSEVYRKAGHEDHLKVSFYPGPHKFDATMQSEAFDWFDRWLGK